MPAEKFLEGVLGSPAPEVGDWLRDGVTPARRRNLQRVASRAAAISRARHQSVGRIPMHTLLPLLENSANEDEPELQERWAALLATAATAPTTVHPSFVRILAQLSAFDARLLSELPRLEAAEAAHGPRDVSTEPTTQPWGVARDAVLARLGSTDASQLDLAITATNALGLVEVHPDHVRLTFLGRRFVLACSV